MRALARGAYRILLQLHPVEFRAEFGDEMLWIFDTQMQRVHRLAQPSTCSYLLLDAVRSLVIQRMLRERRKTPMLESHFHLDAFGTLNYIAQGGFVLLACLFNVFSIALFMEMLVSHF